MMNERFLPPLVALPLFENSGSEDYGDRPIIFCWLMLSSWQDHDGQYQ
jgi:hypothetical protein